MSSIQPPWEGDEWPKVFATSPGLSTRQYLVFRGLWSFIFVIHITLHAYFYIYQQGEGAFYFMYQSRLALIFQTLAMVQQFVAALLGFAQLPRAGGGEPMWVRLAVVLNSYVQPQAFGITYVYWLTMGFMPQMMDQVDLRPIVNYLDVFIHGLNWLLLLVSFWLSRIPFNCASLAPGLVLGALYVLWTYVHHLLRLGTPFGCAQYPDELCPLYDAFDWNRPWRALLFAGLTYFVTAPLNIGAYMALMKLRECIYKEPQKEPEKLAMLEEEARQEPRAQLRCCGCGR